MSLIKNPIFIVSLAILKIEKCYPETLAPTYFDIKIIIKFWINYY
jgi:hypothetical protein